MHVLFTNVNTAWIYIKVHHIPVAKLQMPTRQGKMIGFITTNSSALAVWLNNLALFSDGKNNNRLFSHFCFSVFVALFIVISEIGNLK